MAQQTDLTEQFKPVLLWLSAHFNPQRFFIFLSVILYLVAWNRGIALLYGIVSMLLAILAASYLLPALNIRNISVSLPQRTQCQAGETLSIPVQLYSQSPCQHLCVSIEHLYPSLEDDQPAFASYLRGEARADLKLSCHRRGDFVIRHLVASSSFPFGIHTVKRNIDGPPCHLLVYPKTFAIHALPRFNSRSRACHGQRIINLPHSDEDYAGVREYRIGDNLKHIHWAASARHQELVVCEYESYDRPAMLIILNCNKPDELGQAPDSSFEYSIEIAASLMQLACRQGIAIELFAEGEQNFHLSLPAGKTLGDYHLGQFAQMKANGNADYAQQVTTLCNRFHHIDTVVTFYSQQNADVQHLSNKNHIDVRFDQQSFVDRRLSASHIAPTVSDRRVTYTVQWGAQLESLFNETY